MDKCEKCGMPLKEEGDKCVCQPEVCYHCCKCEPTCKCGCQQKE